MKRTDKTMGSNTGQRPCAAYILSGLLLAFGMAPATLHAAAAAAAPAAVAASQALPAVTGLARNIAEIPLAVADVVRLPLGVTEMVFAPLPGVSFMSGLKDFGVGILAPFKLVGAVLSLPYDLVNTLSDAKSPLPLTELPPPQISPPALPPMAFS
jgi:hypothetical protein